MWSTPSWTDACVRGVLVAAVAARAVLDDVHRGKAYLVLGGVTLTGREQVDAIATRSASLCSSMYSKSTTNIARGARAAR
jgi:hypothetical protein